MKTLGRILIILAASALVMGIAYTIVNGSSSSTSANMPAFERGGEARFRPESGETQFANGEQYEFHDEDHEDNGGWMFGFIKNIGILTIIVLLITVPGKFKRKKTAPLPGT